MRIVGACLILFGFILCLTVIGAPFGVFLIFVGLVCVVVGGRKRVVVNNVVQVSTTPGPSFQQANIPDLEDKRATRPIEAAGFKSSGIIDVTPKPDMTAQSRSGFVYDTAKWDALVAYDSDIARVVDALKPYGQKYVDQLAAAYLAINDKEYLPVIIQKITASAQRDAGGHPAEASA